MQNGEIISSQEQAPEKKGGRSTFDNFRNKRPEPANSLSFIFSSECISLLASPTTLELRLQAALIVCSQTQYQGTSFWFSELSISRYT